MVKDSGSMVKKTVIDLIMLFLPFVLLRLGWFVQVTTLYEHPQTMLGLGDGYFWGNFLYIGVVMVYIYVLFRQDYTGLRLLWLALPLFYFAFLSLPPAEMDYNFVAQRFVIWKFWHSYALSYVMFFSYVICLVKGIVETIKTRRKPKPEISVEE